VELEYLDDGYMVIIIFPVPPFLVARPAVSSVRGVHAGAAMRHLHHGDLSFAIVQAATMPCNSGVRVTDAPRSASNMEAGTARPFLAWAQRANASLRPRGRLGRTLHASLNVMFCVVSTINSVPPGQTQFHS